LNYARDAENITPHTSIVIGRGGVMMSITL